MGEETKILFGSILLMSFMVFMLGIGGSQFLTANINIQPPVPSENTIVNIVLAIPYFFSVIGFALNNPFTAIGIVSWFFTALAITNIYIITRLVRGGG